jgi:hypothetical protein
MNRRNIMIALGALVAGALTLVYAERDTSVSRRISAGAAGEDVAVTGAASGTSQAGNPKVLYDFTALPDPVKRMLRQIAGAAESGDIEAMRPVFESNELKPMVTTSFVDDPIAFWKKASADGKGRDVLAAMLNVLSTGFVRVGQGQDEIYVWPYFAETDLAKLTPPQEVELYRIVPPQLALPMKSSGKYSYYRLGVSPTGVWQYFLQ